MNWFDRNVLDNGIRFCVTIQQFVGRSASRAADAVRTWCSAPEQSASGLPIIRVAVSSASSVRRHVAQDRRTGTRRSDGLRRRRVQAQANRGRIPGAHAGDRRARRHRPAAVAAAPQIRQRRVRARRLPDGHGDRQRRTGRVLRVQRHQVRRAAGGKVQVSGEA